MTTYSSPKATSSVLPDSTWGPATVLTVGLTMIVALVGGAVVLFGDSLSFEDYATVLGLTTVGTGILGVGRGLLLRR